MVKFSGSQRRNQWQAQPTSKTLKELPRDVASCGILEIYRHCNQQAVDGESHPVFLRSTCNAAASGKPLLRVIGQIPAEMADPSFVWGELLSSW